MQGGATDAEHSHTTEEPQMTRKEGGGRSKQWENKAFVCFESARIAPVFILFSSSSCFFSSFSALIRHIPVGPLQCNMIIIADPVTKEATLVDPGGDKDVRTKLRCSGGQSNEAEKMKETEAELFSHFLCCCISLCFLLLLCALCVDRKSWH